MMDIQHLTPEALAAIFDHTLLSAGASLSELEQLCAEARQYGFGMVAINSAPVAFCHEQLKGTPVHVGAAISFPLGQTTLDVKMFETDKAICDGADEIDYVTNLTNVKEGNWNAVENEMTRITQMCREAGVISKVIFENCYLTKEEIRRLAQIAREVGPDFIKTSTGFGTAGATMEDVLLMKEHIGAEVKIKAAGGIRTKEDMENYIKAGCSRLGTSSAVDILEQQILRAVENDKIMKKIWKTEIIQKR